MACGITSAGSFIKYMFASFFTHIPGLRGLGSTTPQQAADIESGDIAQVIDDQHNALSSIADLVVPLTICAGVYPSMPPLELLLSDPCLYSPLAASVFLVVLSAGASLLWRTRSRRRRSIKVAVVFSVVAYLIRILIPLLLLLQVESRRTVGGILFLGISCGGIFLVSLSPWRNTRADDQRPNSLPV